MCSIYGWKINFFFSTAIELLIEHIEIYKSTYPDNMPFFRLLNHKPETILAKLKSLFYAPVFDIGKLTGFDVVEHPLITLVGKSLSYSTLTQFLGNLERINAAKALMSMLLPAIPSLLCYIDGNMIAFWSKKKMHKGKITMLGRIMAGSQGVITHDENGQAIYFEYHPPDIRLPVLIEAYCQRVFDATGIDNFVIDREVNAVAVAKQFTDKGWGLLSMADSNEYKGLSDWETEFIGKLEDGSEVYKGNNWVSKKKEDDPRTYVIVVDKNNNDKLLPFWGTPKLVESVPLLEWPQKYFYRNDNQENAFKRMNKFCSLDVNHGIKKETVPDRHKDRKKKKLEQQLSSKREKIEKTKEKIVEQKEKVKESLEKKHTKRLDQRKGALGRLEDDLKVKQKDECKLIDKMEEVNSHSERADRVFDKQNIMTLRSLLLDNKMMAFLAQIVSAIGEKITIENLNGLFFKRSGSCYETSTAFIYYVNSGGMSLKNKEILCKIIDGINKMVLYHHGKIVHVKMREAPG